MGLPTRLDSCYSNYKDARNLRDRNYMYNNSYKFRSFKNKENIHKTKVGSYHGFGYLSLISDPKIWQKGPEENTVNLLVLIMTVVSKTDIDRKMPKYFKFVKKMNLNV